MRTESLAPQLHSHPMKLNTAQLSMKDRPEAEGDDARTRLRERFATLRISAPTVPYPAHATVDEGKHLRGDMAGTFTKNLLLKDKKGRLFCSRSTRTATPISRRCTRSLARRAVSVSHRAIG